MESQTQKGKAKTLIHKPSSSHGCMGRRRTPRLGASCDRISNLPEPILTHILSLLPTKEAVATSLISKRWKSLWTHIHTLNLSDLQPPGEALLPVNLSPKFVEFVNKVLLFLHGNSINKFYFKTNKAFREDKVYDDLTKWISIAVARNIKAFEFFSMYDDLTKVYDVRHYFPINFPSSFFTCKTLHSLCLRSVKVQAVPSSVHLPNLKTLRLERVCFDESLCRLISACCSSIETLYIERSCYDDVVNFVDEDAYYEDNLVANYKLVIDAPSLRYFHLSDCTSIEISFGNLCSLEKAEIDTRFSDCGEESYWDLPGGGYDARYTSFIAELVRVVCNVKYLSLGGDIFKVLSDTVLFPCFPRLTRLDLVAGYCGLNSLLDLIKGMNQLRWLVVRHYQLSRSKNVTSWRKPKEVPLCLSSCLEEISIVIMPRGDLHLWI